jgi:aspartate/glutamate racemase
MIHALAHSVAPINDAMARQWPGAERVNLLDDSLSRDLAAGRGGPAMEARFLSLGAYAIGSGAEAILFTCSAFGTCIEAVQQRWPALPVLKPNEAMIDEAVAAAGGRPIGLLASFAPTAESMPREFPAGARLEVELAAAALEALDAGDLDGHDRAALRAGQALAARGCAVIALAQFSLARAAPLLRSSLRVPVLTTVDSAIAELRRRLGERPGTAAT